jgi:RES domain
MAASRTTLPEGHEWLRVADQSWSDPLDASYADREGGRWNAPGDGPTLYLNADLDTARAQVRRLLAGTPIDPEDLRDDAPYVLVRAVLPTHQRVADATHDTGLAALRLPRTYPLRARGGEVAWSECRRAARAVRAEGLRGVLARSAATPDGSGRELAWFPSRQARARSVGDPWPFVRWRHAAAP